MNLKAVAACQNFACCCKTHLRSNAAATPHSRHIGSAVLATDRLALSKCTIQRAQLPQKYPPRPPVGDDVMHGDQQDMLLIVQTDESAANQRAMLQIEVLIELGPLPSAPRTTSAAARTRVANVRSAQLAR
jgi:hypothetical protein